MKRLLLLMILIGTLAIPAQAQSCKEALVYYYNPIDGEDEPHWVAQSLCSDEPDEISLSTAFRDQNVGYFQFSPSNDSIAYGNTSIYVLSEAEPTPRILLVENEATFYHDPILSPDGMQLVAVETDETGAGDWLVVTDLDGQHRRLTQLSDDAVRRTIIVPIGWSPDGEWISYTLSQQVDEETWDANILLLNTSCVQDAAASCESRPLEITDDSGERSPLTLPNGNMISEHWWGAAWSPDGTRLAFVCGDHLCFLNADGTDYHRSVFVFNGHSLAWSLSGRYLAYFAGDDVFVYDIEADEHINVTQTPGVQEILPTWIPLPEGAFLFEQE